MADGILKFDPDTFVLHQAAGSGQVEAVSRILTARPELINASASHWTALHRAASNGHDGVVAVLLALDPNVQIDPFADVTPLHLAARGGYSKVVEQLLAASPHLITALTRDGTPALHLASNEKVFTQLLDACPRLIDALCGREYTALHCAADNGCDSVVAPIMALRPEMATAVNRDGRTPLMYAIFRCSENVAEAMLAVKPDLVYETSQQWRHTTLHCALISRCSNPFIIKLWHMNPQARLHVNEKGDNVFDLAVRRKRDELIELFQWSFSFDEIVSAFTLKELDYQTRYRPVMKKQCESLSGYLNRDVVDIVFEFLFGLAPAKKEEKPLKTKESNRRPKKKNDAKPRRAELTHPHSMGGHN